MSFAPSNSCQSQSLQFKEEENKGTCNDVERSEHRKKQAENKRKYVLSHRSLLPNSSFLDGGKLTLRRGLPNESEIESAKHKDG